MTEPRESGTKAEKGSRFQRFKDEYLRTGNAHRAALNAGYSRLTAKKKSYRMAAQVRAEQNKTAQQPQTQPKVSYLRRLPLGSLAWRRRRVR